MLIAENEPINRMIAQDMVEVVGLKADLALDGAEDLYRTLLKWLEKQWRLSAATYLLSAIADQADTIAQLTECLFRVEAVWKRIFRAASGVRLVTEPAEIVAGKAANRACHPDMALIDWPASADAVTGRHGDRASRPGETGMAFAALAGTHSIRSLACK